MASVQTPDGLALHLQHWPQPAARARVLIVHGLGEHIGRYDALARALNAAGYAVSGHDQRGHGRSPGGRGAIPAADSLCSDLAAVIDTLQTADGRAPLLLGHSLGGLVAARFVAEALAAQPASWSRPLPKLMLSSPALNPGMNGAQRLLLAVLGSLAPNLAVNNGLTAAWRRAAAPTLLPRRRLLCCSTRCGRRCSTRSSTSPNAMRWSPGSCSFCSRSRLPAPPLLEPR